MSKPDKLVFVDLETTGLDPGKHEVIEIAAIETSLDGRIVFRTYHRRIIPQFLDRADPEALAINGYSASEWADAVPRSKAIADLNVILRGAVLVGHNVSFDEGFLTALMPRVWHHHKVDTVSLIWPRYMADKSLTSLSLNAVCKYLGVGKPNHRALADAEACRQVYALIMDK